MVAPARAKEAGSAKRRMLLVKSRPALEGGVVMAMKMEGMPKVKSAVREPWRGRKGKSRPSRLEAKMMRKA